MLRSKLIRLAATFPPGSDRTALLRVLAAQVPDLPEVPSVSIPRLSKAQREYLMGAVNRYPEPARTSRGRTSLSLLELGLLEPPDWLPLDDTGYSADFYPLTEHGFRVAQAVYREEAIRQLESKIELLTTRGKSPERITKILERLANRFREGLLKKWRG